MGARGCGGQGCRPGLPRSGDRPRRRPCRPEALPFPTTRSASSNPFTGSEKVTAIENAPVTGSLAELVMVTVGAAVFAVMENWSAAALGFPELSCAAPAAMSTVTVPETSGVIVAVCRSRGSPPAAASPDTAPPESSGSYRAFGGRLQGCPPRGVRPIPAEQVVRENFTGKDLSLCLTGYSSTNTAYMLAIPARLATSYTDSSAGTLADAQIAVLAAIVNVLFVSPTIPARHHRDGRREGPSRLASAGCRARTRSAAALGRRSPGSRPFRALAGVAAQGCRACRDSSAPRVVDSGRICPRLTDNSGVTLHRVLLPVWSLLWWQRVCWSVHAPVVAGSQGAET